LLQPGSSLSQRLTTGVAGQIALLEVDAQGSYTVRLAATETAASVQLLRWHLAVYRHRSDVGAILANHQPWAQALNQLGCGMPGIFDEQIRHLGTSVKLLENKSVDDGQYQWLRRGENAFVLNQNVLCLGMTLDRCVFNAELLEKCSKAFVLATCTGKPVDKIPWLIRYIANGRLMKDEKYAASQHALGQIPVFKSAY
jgi:ribulose-5-phosphate 4-epimerase/fuculose-1-phosphate aldolase